MPAPSPALEVAERLFAAIHAGDVAAAGALYADDAVIWHNNDNLVQTPDENLRVLRWVVRNVKDLRYEEIRRIETANGFVQQHVLRGIAPNGQPLEVPACLIVTVAEGRITRFDEYLDSAHTAVLRG